MSQKLEQTERWIIVYLIYADFVNPNTDVSIPLINKELLTTLDSLCEDLITCTINKEKLSIYAIFSTINYSVDSNTDGRFEGKSQTLIFKIEEPKHGFERNHILSIDPVKSYKDAGEKKIGRSVQKIEDLKNAFQTIEAKEKESYQGYNSRILLTTWDHGSAFGIFKKNDRQIEVMVDWKTVVAESCFFYINEFVETVPKAIKANFLAQNTNRKSYLLKNTKVFEVDEAGTKNTQLRGGDLNKLLSQEEPSVVYEVEILHNRELAESIRQGFSKNSVDVLVMMNCWMLNIDTAYWLKDAVSILIAPQTGIEFPAYNYKKMLAFIHSESLSNRPINCKDLAKTIITSVNDTSGKRAAKHTCIAEWAIFAIDLSVKDSSGTKVIEDLVSALSEFASYFIELIERYKKTDQQKMYALTNLFKFCTSLSYNFDEENRYFQFDLSLVIFNLLRFNTFNLIDNIKLRDFNKNFKDTMYSLNACSPHIGVNWNETQPYRTEINPIGLSLYFPTVPYEQDGNFNDIIKREINAGSYNISFFKACPEWLHFIDTILAH